jgi:hypothetical protein
LNYVLKFGSPRRIRRALTEAMPKELFDLYEIIMSKITHSEGDSKDLALRTLSWVLYAKRPFHINELREAVAIEGGDHGISEEDLTPAQILVNVCGSFLIYDEESGVIELAHETVKEFLLLLH